ncbi:MAG TPA: hypothetical protein PLV96_07210 [Methanoregulaceae archaeon]|jgi:hypothetical protein|nr:hypothetical protein [Methanoregulaceae archaeon]
MAEVKVQIAVHFKIDPAKQSIGLIDYPGTVNKTVSIGDHIIPSTVSFSEAFRPEDLGEITKELEKLALESTRTAKPLSSSESRSADPISESGCEDTCGGETGESGGNETFAF